MAGSPPGLGLQLQSHRAVVAERHVEVPPEVGMVLALDPAGRIIADRVHHQPGQRDLLRLLSGIVGTKHEHRRGQRGKAGIQGREWGEGRELEVDGKVGIMEPERGQRIFARHGNLLDPRPVGTAARLQQPRGRAGADQEVERNLAVTQGVEELPGGELPVRPDLEVSCADPPQVHPGIGMRAGIINPPEPARAGLASTARDPRASVQTRQQHRPPSRRARTRAAAPMPTSSRNSRRETSPACGPHCPEHPHFRVMAGSHVA